MANNRYDQYVRGSKQQHLLIWETQEGVTSFLVSILLNPGKVRNLPKSFYYLILPGT